MTFLDNIINKLNNSIFRYSEVLDYLYSRKVTNDDIKKYQIGFSKIVTYPFDNTLDCKNFSEEFYNGKRLENTIIFPSKDSLGRNIGLSSRTIKTKSFKLWANEAAKFNGFFFGLFEALPYIYKENRVYVVEGPFDLLAFSKVYPNSVSTLTAGINDNQYDMLKMFCDSIILVFDSDKAGKSGSEKAFFDSKGQPREGIFSVDIKYKDPAKILEELDFKEFKKYLNRIINTTFV